MAEELKKGIRLAVAEKELCLVIFVKIEHVLIDFIHHELALFQSQSGICELVGRERLI